MNLARFSVRKPITVFIAVVVVLVVGIMGVSFISIDLYPEINPPVLMISTTYRGAQPEQVEERITRPLESALLNVSGLKKLTSTSSKDSSMVALEFDWGEDLVEAANEARDKIEMVRKWLPEEADSPMMFKFDTSMMPIMNLTVSGVLDADELRETAKDKIVPLFEQIDGVVMASLRGGQEPIVLVSADQNRLDALGLTLNAVSQVIGSQNVDAGGGDIKEGETSFSIKTTGEYTSLEQISETVIMTTPSGRPVRIQDVATVEWGHKDRDSVAMVNGNPALMINIQKQSGANSTVVANNVLKALPKLASAFPGIQIDLLYDSTELIRNTISEVVHSLISGVVLAVLVIFLFMRSLRSMLIIGISIPICLLVTLAAMYFSGLTLNLFTLTGLILGLGMIVDSSIVILENIFRYREKGAKLDTAAVSGAGEMTGAIVGSTLTTVCVFLPMVMFAEKLDMIGLIMEPLAFTIIISLLSSLVVSVTLVPVMAARFPKVYTTQQRPIRFWPLKKFDQAMEWALSRLDRGYRWCLTQLLLRGRRSKGISAAFLALIALLVAVSTVGLFSGGLNMAPEGSEDSVALNIRMKEGTRIETTAELLLRFQEDAQALLTETDESGAKIRHYQHFILEAGGSGMGSVEEYKGTLTVLLPDAENRKYDANGVKNLFRSLFPKFPGAEFSFGNGRNSMSGFSPIDIKVLGLDLKQVMATATEIKELLEKKASFALEPTTDFDEGMPQLLVTIDRQKAYEKGLTMVSIGREVLANIEGVQSSVFRQNGQEFDLYVRLKERDRSNIVDLERVSVTNPRGQRIPLASFSDVRVTTGAVKIKRENQQRSAHVQAKTVPGMTASDATRKVMALINDEMVLDSGVVVTPSGDVEAMGKMSLYIGLIFFLAVLLVFAVMASIFENLTDPFIIFLTLFTLPIGIAFFHWVSDNQLSLLSVVGMVMLVGIVVNNGIVLVDYTNLLRKRSVPLLQAALQAGVNRLRPVLMTSLTTILGMVPMAFFPSEGASMIRPIGLTVIGGMTVSTFLTLLMVPVIYVAFEQSRIRRARRWEQRRQRWLKRLIRLKWVPADTPLLHTGETIDFSDCIDAAAGEILSAAAGEIPSVSEETK